MYIHSISLPFNTYAPTFLHQCSYLSIPMYLPFNNYVPPFYLPTPTFHTYVHPFLHRCSYLSIPMYLPSICIPIPFMYIPFYTPFYINVPTFLCLCTYLLIPMYLPSICLLFNTYAPTFANLLLPLCPTFL